jgi:hypothetical protein
MLRLEALEVSQRFRKPGGDDFVLYVNKIIRASCWAGGVPQSEVWTTSRTDAKDKGVDTRVGKAIPGDKSGYFGAPTIWQFKAADESNVSKDDMAKEVNKPRAKQSIIEGSAYRLCICDHLTPDKKQVLLDGLSAAVTAINRAAPQPAILSIDDLVDLTNSFPALVLEYRPHLDEMVLLFERWRQSARGITPIFVPPSGFDATKTAVLTHVNFALEVPSPVLALYGSAGAGKTRAALECLQDVPAASSLCLYLSSEDGARDLANMLVNDLTAHAIIVADECSIEMREQLVRTLMNFRDRVRCVCIDNSMQRISTPSPELIIPKLSPLELEKVLKANFAGIPSDRLRAYAQYCDGSVRLAADMCAHFDAEIAQAGSMSPALDKTGEYYHVRLASDLQRRAVEAIALLRRVRHKGEVPTDLDLICELIGAERKDIEQGLSQIKDSPGWVEKGALYYRVTPELIAMTAFMCAWNRWAKDDEHEFLQRLPASIQESFLQRVSESASPEVREIVQRFFRRFIDDFSSSDLAKVDMVNRLVTLIDTDSFLYLPALRRVVESATAEELTGGPEWTGGSWGPRRQLVWAAEKFAIFPEHFKDCEALLFTLALNESEPRIGNNATKIWQGLFRLQLSGSSLPFIDRLDLLKRRLMIAKPEQAELFCGALNKILDLMGARLLGPAVIGGRVPPSEWHPKTWEEMRDSVKAGLALLDEMARHPVPEIAKRARRALIGDLDTLTRNGWVDELRPFVGTSNLDESDRAQLVALLKRFLGWGKHLDDSEIKPEYGTKIEDWIKEIGPTSFHARLVELVGSDSINHFKREKEWGNELDGLARELLADGNLFNAEIAWLTSTDAKSAFEFGNRLGAIDGVGALIDSVLKCSRGRAIGFARGYVSGLLYATKLDPAIVNARLDDIEKQDPLFSFEIALAGGAYVSAFDRAIRLIESAKIATYHLRNFTYWVGNVRVTNEQVLRAIRLLLPLAATDSFACDVMVDFLGARFHSQELSTLLEMDKSLVWESITVAARNPGHETYWLTQVLRFAASTDWALAIELACDAMVSENYQFGQDAENLLANWASVRPEEVMAGIGAKMLDEKVGWRFFASKFGVFGAIPADVVIGWLETAGVNGARKIARHLPKPYLDASGSAAVPPLTAFVLSRFEDDDPTFREFCAGTHSMQMYVGDIARQRESEAASARAFFNHPLRRIREWARYEYDSGIHEAQLHREHEDEAGFG